MPYLVPGPPAWQAAARERTPGGPRRTRDVSLPRCYDPSVSERTQAWTRAACAAAMLAAGRARGQAGDPAAPSLDLAAAVELACERNLALARTAAAVRRAEADLRSARSDFALRLRPDAQAAAADDRVDRRFGLGAARLLRWGGEVQWNASVQQADAAFGDTSRAVVSLGVEQPLFRRFGALVAMDRVETARGTLNERRRAYEQQKENLVVDLAEDFEAVLRLRRQTAFDREAVGRTEKLLRLTGALERQGRAGRADVLRADLELGLARQRLAASKEQQALREAQLAERLGRPPGTPLELVPPPLVEVPDTPLEDAVRVALSRRLDYAQALEDLAHRRRGLRLARRDRWPDLRLAVRYERIGEDDPGAAGGWAWDGDRWWVGLATGSDVNPARDRASVDAAGAEADAAWGSARLLELAVARDVQRHALAYRRARLGLEIADRNARLAAAGARLARRLFAAGRGDHFAVAEAETALAAAETERLSARADACVSGYRLLRARGTLVEHPDDLLPRREESS